MSTPTENPNLPVQNAVNRFLELNDDLAAVQAVSRRVFFEFLRTKPTLSTDEIEIIASCFELLAGLDQERKQGPTN